MSVAPSLCKSLIHHIQQMGILSFDGEQSLGIRLLRVFDLLKNSKKAQKVVPLLPTMWRLLLGKNHHTLYLTHPVKMHILPSNLISLIYLWGNLPCERIEPEQNVIVWQLAPGCLLKSLTNEGTELTVLVELLIRKEYGTNYQGLKVLDIGGYFGESAIFFVSAGAESVVCVEPYPPALRRISENLKLSSIKDRVKVIAAAVGPERGEGLLLVSKADPMGNALQGLEGPKVVTNSSSAVKVPTLTFEDVLNEANWEVVDVTKLDCEGCEYAIFSTVSDENLRRVKVWIIEFHDGAERLLQRLRHLGYQTRCHQRPNKTGIIWAWLPEATLP